MFELIFNCPFCGAEHSVVISETELDNINRGMLIQDACPNLSATEREQIISNICPACQKEIFG